MGYDSSQDADFQCENQESEEGGVICLCLFVGGSLSKFLLPGA